MFMEDVIREKLKDANIKKVSRASGVGYQSILRLMKGEGIRREALRKLIAYLEYNNESKT